jgi:hypothetical protein
VPEDQHYGGWGLESRVLSIILTMMMEHQSRTYLPVPATYWYVPATGNDIPSHSRLTVEPWNFRGMQLYDRVIFFNIATPYYALQLTYDNDFNDEVEDHCDQGRP